MKGPDLPIYNSQCILLLPVTNFYLFQQLLTVSTGGINAVHLQHMTLRKWGVGKRFSCRGKGTTLRTRILVNVNQENFSASKPLYALYLLCEIQCGCS